MKVRVRCAARSLLRGCDVSETLIRLDLHADSARDRPLDPPAPVVTLARSYLPGFVVMTLENPLRVIVVSAERLVDALESI